MAAQGNMGPFGPVRFQGGARINASPVFVDKLPLTLGGIAGVDAYFGRIVSRQGNSHQFLKGIPTGANACGMLVWDPTIAYASPAMQNFYFEGRPATVVTYGLIELMDYDLAYQAPTFGSKVIANNDDGHIAFIGASDSVPSGWTQLNAAVYDTMEPNGVKLWLNTPIVAPNFTVLPQAATPVADPAAGAVAAGTKLMLTTATVNAQIRYTLDGTTPTFSSPVFPPEGLSIVAPVTVKAIATRQDLSPSAMLTAAYTIS